MFQTFVGRHDMSQLYCGRNPYVIVYIKFRVIYYCRRINKNKPKTRDQCARFKSDFKRAFNAIYCTGPGKEFNTA